MTQENHRIQAYSISIAIEDGGMIELGDRKLEVLLIPGHTDDALALLEGDSGFLWAGDSFYEGSIWLYFPETDLVSYKNSLNRLVALVPQFTALSPAHRITV